jgi:hypothetical protein
MITKKEIPEKAIPRNNSQAVFDECIELYGNKTNEDYLQLLEQTQSRFVRNSNNQFETDLLQQVHNIRNGTNKLAKRPQTRHDNVLEIEKHLR